MPKFPDLPPVWLLGSAVLVWALGRWMPIWTHEQGWLQVFGAVVVLAGMVLIFWAGTWFWRKHTSIEPGHQPQVLIVEGPYRLSRNPIYLGMAVILTGVIIWTCALSGVVILPIFVWVIDRRFIRWEEAMLRQTFGAGAEAYLTSTRRWL